MSRYFADKIDRQKIERCTQDDSVNGIDRCTDSATELRSSLITKVSIAVYAQVRESNYFSSYSIAYKKKKVQLWYVLIGWYPLRRE